jgi:oxygen-independent coproporphyrinogen-3 oxidase
MGLRLTEGVAIAPIERKLGRALPAGRLADLESRGLVSRIDGRLRATPRGRLVLNALLKEIAA